jgi:hypothetical protein
MKAKYASESWGLMGEEEVEEGAPIGRATLYFTLQNFKLYQTK